MAMVSVPDGGLNFMVVPVGAAEKVEPPNRLLVVPPKGLEVVLVFPKRPPLLVLVPNVPKVDGFACPKALLCWDEKRPPPPVFVDPNKEFAVPVEAPKPKAEVVEEVAGCWNVVVPNSPPGLFCVVPNNPPLLFAPNADVVPNPVACVVPNPAFCPNVDVAPKAPLPPPNGEVNDLLNMVIKTS